MTSIREDGFAPIADYGAIGDGRSVALVARDGSVDWWCALRMDGAPLFDRLLDSGVGFMAVAPVSEYSSRQRYKKESNVLETVFTTGTGTLVVTDSLNSGAAGRLPWSELGRRIECTEGSVTADISFRFSPLMHDGTWSGEHGVYRCGDTYLAIIGAFKKGETVTRLELTKGDRHVIGVVATANGLVTIPTVAAVDDRIDRSDSAWRSWAGMVRNGGVYHDDLVRSLLALKLLLYSPSGAIAASATMGLPERIGGDKNYDYRFAWVRDTAYTIKAMIRSGLTEEVHAALGWLLKAVRENGIEVFYTLDGRKSDGVQGMPYGGYKNSKPVIRGNKASGQLQLGIYGDILETVHLYVEQGNVLDEAARTLVAALTDECARKWRRKDAGIWELGETRHYTISKIGCWMALDRALALCDNGALPDAHRKVWERERDAVAAFIEKKCWDKKRGRYAWYAGSNGIDASLMLAARFGYPQKERLDATLRAIESELKYGAYVYRYTGASDDEGAFTACAYWLVEGYAFSGHTDTAASYLADVLRVTRNGLGLSSEMADPVTGELLGNMPQGLSHLAMVHAIDAVLQTGGT